MDVAKPESVGVGEEGTATGAANNCKKAGHSKKKGKPKSRNNFDDVQRMEMVDESDPRSAIKPITTIELLAQATGLDDLSQKLEERLTLNATLMANGNNNTPGDEEHPGTENGLNRIEAETKSKPCIAADNIDARCSSNRNSSDNQSHNNDTIKNISNSALSPSKEHQQEADNFNLNIVYCTAKNEEVHVVEDTVSSGIESGGSPTTSDPNTSLLLSGASSSVDASNDTKIEYQEYESELQMPDIMRLIQKDLSEPYSIYTYRYFIHNWPKLCFLAMDGERCVGAIVCKLGMHRQIMKRGYIAMLAVDKEYRKLKIGTNLVQKAIEAMLKEQADEVVLETEITNTPALRLYENLGFVRDKRLFHYYLNGVDALRLKLWFR